jgi:hypothetical protein
MFMSFLFPEEVIKNQILTPEPWGWRAALLALALCECQF